MPATFTVSLAALNILSEHLNTSLRTFPFEPPLVGQFIEERERIADAVWNDLVQRDLAIRPGELHENVALALRLLTTATTGIAVLGTAHDLTIAARACGKGKHAVLAVEHDTRLRFTTIFPTALAREAVGLLPQLPAGPGRSITVTNRSADRKPLEDNEDRSFLRQPRAARGATREDRELASLMSRPSTGGGFFAVTHRDQMGRQQTSSELTWMDTEAGRYLIRHHPEQDGPGRTTVSPADTGRLVEALRSLACPTA
ncbi:ESAT-6 protein secretion system EspG family protein [Herbihabitans rhizosphaerae]|uniref:ESAT-6 protein secretion system EspG family protein n=1 Tax=Herbihabitans rhizosphaerae TaxID=1872711 RepID=A0A4V2ES19_9PSEU|nr:ESX secretion-associated protein EspG [Herbihabitans rhizosphaerae]RZS34827.1 ESAT-6 protein secretion system EspG family protein [Herbihabitans rhizosphaerae]